MSDEHPVLAAIAAERERLSEVNSDLQRQQFEVIRELQALHVAEEALREAMGEDMPPRDRPEQSSPEPRPAAPKPSSPKPARAPSSDGLRAIDRIARDDRVHEALVKSTGDQAASAIARAAGVEQSQIGTSLKRLEKVGKVTRTGSHGGTRWSAAQGARQAVSEGPGKRQVGSEDGKQDGSLEGRLMQSCMMEPATLPELCGRLAPASPVDVRSAVGKLVKEGELRTRHKNGQTVYAFVG